MTTSEYQLHCQFNSQTGSIERLLRVIRVRGFTVLGMQLEITQAHYHCQLKVTGTRRIENLIHQLQNLVEVVAVGLPESAAPALVKCA